MTDRLADVTARIQGMRQLGAVVNAMCGIAAARAQQATRQLTAADSYAETVAAAVASVLPRRGAAWSKGVSSSQNLALVVFCAEQGFAGAFSERVLASVEADLSHASLFLIGTRGEAAIEERGVAPDWKAAMPSHSPAVPGLADRITEAVFAAIGAGKIDRLDAVYAQWRPAHGVCIERRRLLPLDIAAFKQPATIDPPLRTMPLGDLLQALSADYLHAQLCRAALHAFAAENEARMQAMDAARSQVQKMLGSLRARQRRVRQEEITAEVIELAAGETANRAAAE